MLNKEPTAKYYLQGTSSIQAVNPLKTDGDNLLLTTNSTNYSLQDGKLWLVYVFPLSFVQQKCYKHTYI